MVADEYTPEEIRHILHLQPDISALLCLPVAERLKALEKDIWIEYPRVEKALKRMKELLWHEKRTRMPNLLVIGPTNNGKTMLKEKFYRFNQEPFGQDELDVKVYPRNPRLVMLKIITMQMPTAPSLRRFLLALADGVEQLRHFSDMVVSAMERELYKIIKDLQVQMIMIDELHNILAGANKQQLELLNMLRYLGNELKVPLVCFGTKDAYLAIQRDPQLENRFEPIVLPLWRAGREFELLLDSFITVLPLKYPSDLRQPAIVKLLLARSEGILGEVATILKQAAAKAIETGQEMIDLKLLESIDYQSPTERRRDFARISA